MFAEMGGQDTSVMPKVIFPGARQQARTSAESSPASPVAPAPLEPYEGYQRINLTLNVVDPSERDKFHSLSRPETFREIRPNREPGQRGAYSVEMTYEEYQRALADVQDRSVNLVAADPRVRIHRHVVPDAGNLTYLNASGQSGTGAKIGLLDDGVSSTIASMFASQIFASNDSSGDDSALSTPSGNPHGSFMIGLAVPPGAQVAVAKCYDNAANGFDDFVAASIYWLVDTVDVHVINMSFGASEIETVLRDAVAHAVSQGVMCCASAGNEGTNDVQFPADLSGVLKITSYDRRTDAITSTSSFGGSVFAAAPGAAVTGYNHSGAEEYMEDGGTSSAAAFATRMIALEVATGKSPSAARNALAANARSTGAGSAYEGYGVLRLLEEPVSETPPPLEGAPDTGDGPGMGPPDDSPPDTIDPDTGEVIDPGGSSAGHWEQMGDGTPTACIDIAVNGWGAVWLMDDGTVYHTGNTDYPPLIFEDNPYPTQVTELEDVMQIATGDRHYLALKTDGTVWGWGNGGGGVFGAWNAASLDENNTTVPIQITDDCKGVGANYTTSFFIKNDGTLWAVGEQWIYCGILDEDGNPPVEDFDSTQQLNRVGALENVVKIKASASLGDDPLALTEDGSLYFWGDNTWGIGGFGLVPSSGGFGGSFPPTVYTPTVIPGMDSVVSFDVYSTHVAAAKEDGTAWGWGTADGLGSDIDEENDCRWDVTPLIYACPQQVQDVSNVVEVGTGDNFSWFLESDGTFKMAGENYDGAFGIGEEWDDPGVFPSYHKYPIVVDWSPDVGNIKRRFSGQYGMWMVNDLCEVYAAGQNWHGLLGIAEWGDVGNAYFPTRVIAGQEKDPLSAQATIRAGGESSMARAGGGATYAWGQSPLQTSEPTHVAQEVASIGAAADYQVSGGHVVVLGDDGTVWTSGTNTSGELGDGTTDSSFELFDTGVTGASKVIAGLAYSMALLANGEVRAWGGIDDPDEKYLGTGKVNMDPAPDARVPNAVVLVPPGGFGVGEDVSPSAFPHLDDVTDLWSGYMCHWARTSTGIIYQWGWFHVYASDEDASNPGEYLMPNIGNDNYPQALMFDQVPADWDYPFTAATISDVQFGEGFGTMLRTDGTLVSFGDMGWIGDPDATSGTEYLGQLGRPNWTGMAEDREDHFLPTEIPDISGVAQITCGQSHTAALLTDGTVWCWGRGASGQMGDGEYEVGYSPGQVVGGEQGGAFLENIEYIAAGSDHTLALDSGGTVWAWGSGVGGALGDGTQDSSNVPVRVLMWGDVIDFWICTPGSENCTKWIPGDTVPALPAFEDDPVITQPAAAKINYEPEKFPDVDVTLPDAPLAPGDPFEFKKPQSPDPPEPFNANQMKIPTPSADPCNSGMPAPGGGVCGPTNPADTPIGQNPTGAGENLGGFKSAPGVDLHGVGKGGGSGSQESKYFKKDTCYKNKEVNVIIVQLSTLLKLDPAKVQVNEDCDERYTGCFKKGSNIFDALKKMAKICGGVFNPGGGGGVVTPPTPKDVHHYLSEYSDIFYLERLYNNQDNFAKVEVFRPPKIVNGTYYPGVSKVAEVSTPFEPDLDSVKTIYTYDYNLTDVQIQNMANVEASKTSGSGARCQITVLYDDKYKLYEQLHLQRPSINWYTKWMIRTIAHTFSVNGQLTVMEATYLGSEGAPEMTSMSEVLLDPVAVGFSVAA